MSPCPASSRTRHASGVLLHEEPAKDALSASRFLVCSRQHERLVPRLLLGVGRRRRVVGQEEGIEAAAGLGPPPSAARLWW
jgi:hypothetical protein